MTAPRARLEIGTILNGQDGSLSVVSCLVFRERDREDGCFYSWEEWLLLGEGAQDVWLEVDHDTGEVFLYEPMPFTEPINARYLAPDQILTVTSGGVVYAARVTQVGAGELREVVGTADLRIRRGERLGYAELELTDAQGAITQATIDSHHLRDVLSYRKIPLPASEQRRRFGRVLYRPRLGRRSSSDHDLPRSVAAASAESGRRMALWLLGGIGIVTAMAVVAACDDDEEQGGSGSGSGGSYRPVHGGGGGGVGK